MLKLNYEEELKDLFITFHFLSEFTKGMDFIKFEEFAGDDDLMEFEYININSRKIMKAIEQDTATAEEIKDMKEEIEGFISDSVLWIYESQTDRLFERVFKI